MNRGNNAYLLIRQPLPRAEKVEVFGLMGYCQVADVYVNYRI